MRIKNLIPVSLVSATLLLALAPSVSAQSPTPKEIIGLTDSAVYLNRMSMNKSTCASKFCSVLNFEKRVSTYRNGDNFGTPATWTGTAAGGTARDSRHGGVWISNGNKLACVDPLTCTYLCKPIDLLAANSPIPAPNASTWRKVITGLCCVESGEVDAKGVSKGGPVWLFASWMSNHISKIEVSRDSSGNWKFVTKHCLFTRDVSNTQCKIAGLAADDKGRKLMVATSCFAARAGVVTTVHVTNMDATDWCARTCFFRLPILDPTNGGKLAANNPVCPNLGWTDQTLITGLAYDSCHDRLYITDGLKVIYGKLPIDAAGTRCGVSVKNAAGATVRIFQIEGCCPLSLRSQQFTGIALYPNKVDTGSSCTQQPCNGCSKMTAGTVGDAVLGNPSFGLKLSDAPDNWTRLALGIGVGSCSQTGADLGFCSTIRIPLTLPTLLFFQNPNPSGTGCNGSQSIMLGAIPPNVSLCGLKVSTQWVVACGSAGKVGYGVSNCHQFEVQAN
jgi:hypothetical protein